MTAPVITFVPTVPKKNASEPIPLADLPDYIGPTVEEAYTALKSNDGNFHVAFDTKQELLQWEKQMKSYCELRIKDSKPAPLYYRRSPTKNPEGAVNFRITDTPAKNKADTDGIKEAAAKVTAAAKTTK